MKGDILEDFLKSNENGLYCTYGDFYLDASRPVKNVIVSHAHGDHISPGCSNVFCTAPTRSLMEYRLGKNAGNHFFTYSYDNALWVGNVKVTFLPAGHILGSALILMEYEGTRYLYTGDYKVQADATCEPLTLLPADVLITESTFANPKIKHPDDITEILKLNTISDTIMLGCYSLGKAQRLTALINKYCPQKIVLLHHSIVPYHKVYESYGFKDWNYLPYSRKMVKNNQQNLIYLVPPLTFNSYVRAKNVVRVFASGWEKLQNRNGIELFISDHVDWYDIIETIKTVMPKEIWTLHGDGKYLADFYEGSILVKHL
ncbi:MBL fold metallo-hydrolase [Olivibacter domesticus]|uniref:Putative mRNA 3-end processing factor n=1 Tax=Olivibacter domesticus TaxID=407022 RepID=A0A1H7LKL4_OLID1|nr:MBL fold metallo-hydrolase [Olivibacter domesticus]SEK99512.1 putative mRNA 3-end processing factor [Olivibacter domesticus]